MSETATLRLVLDYSGCAGTAGFASIIARLQADRNPVSLPIPPSAMPHPTLRLSFLDFTGFLQVHSIKVCDRAGEIVWVWDGYAHSLPGSAEKQPVLIDAPPDTAGVLAIISATENSLQLPFVPAVAGLHSGGVIQMELSQPEGVAEFFERDDVHRKHLLAQYLVSQQQNLLGERERLLWVKLRFQKRLKERISSIYRSSSWRATAPLRALVQLARQVSPSFMVAKQQSWQPRDRRPTRPVNTIDVIVPVFRGFEDTRRCLESVLRSRNMFPFEVIVVDDCSPEPELVDYVEKLAARGAITLLRNSSNFGYIRSVNRGMSLHGDRDVVLLNSDTEVANDWLDRLRACAYSQSRIGTATPFSNNATICSYPQISVDNPLPDGWSLRDLDRLFSETHQGQHIEIPTAVGFCMFIRRECLRQVGEFDARLFGRGYGEENHFSLRAGEKGWTNVLCADTFVYHRGSVSFGEERDQAVADAMEKLRALYPRYEPTLLRHSEKDPARSFREAVDLGRLKRSPRPKILFVSHNSGGGTSQHVEELANLFSNEVEALLLQPGQGNSLRLRWLRRHEKLRLDFDVASQYQSLLTVLRSLNIRRIHIHHVGGFGPELQSLVRALAVPFDFTVHDYYSVCPQLKLWNQQDQFCGQPDELGCNACLRASDDTRRLEINSWRSRHLWTINEADRVFVPSLDAARRMRRYCPDAGFTVCRHPDADQHGKYPAASPRLLGNQEVMRIAVLGTLGPEKGSRLLDQCAVDAVQRGLPIEFHLLGTTLPKARTVPKSCLTEYGAYDNGNVPSFFRQCKPHVVWFPALWPETYSYTLSLCLESGLPIVAPDLGAFPERLSGRSWSWVRQWSTDPTYWNNFFLRIADEYLRSGLAPVPPSFETANLNFSYATDYLQPLGLSL